MDSISLKDAVAHIVDNRGKTCPTSDAGIPLIATNCVKSSSLYPTKEKIRFVGAETYRTWFRGHPEPGDVLFVNKGSPGEVCLVPDPVDFCIAQDMVSLRPDNEKIDPSYFFAALREKRTKAAIENMHVGTMIPHFKKTDFDKLYLPLPPRRDQEFIGKLYLDLSMRITVNEKMNQTLEDIAKAIFKAWFVDFDPVHAKAEGRPTGLPAEISDLFPDAFEDPEIGAIPAGWNERRFSDCEIEIESGRRPKGGIDKSLSEGIPSIGAESIAPAGIFDFSKVKYVTEEFAAKMKRGKVQDFDVALYKDGGKPGQFIPRVGIYGDEFPFSECYVNEHVFLLRSRYLGQPFLYRMVSSNDFLNQLIAKGSAKAAQPGLNQEEVASNRLIVPIAPLLRVFNQMTEPMLKRQFLLGKEIKVLSELRDTLLPKLIYGELRIPDVEKFLQEGGL